MKKQIGIISLVFLAFCLTACNDSSKKNQDNIETLADSTEDVLIRKIEDAIRDKEIGIAFRSYTNQDDLKLSSSLQLAKTGLITLRESTDEYSAYIRLNGAVKTYEDALILEIDQPRLDNIFNEVRTIMSKIDVKLENGESLEAWNLYNYNFGSGVEPEFMTYSRKTKWGFNLQTDVPKAAVAGQNSTNAWMVSRSFKLSEVESPSFRFKTVLLVESKDQTLNRQRAIQEIFQVYIVLHPKAFEGFENYTDEDIKKDARLIRVKYNTGDWPLGEQFHKRWMPPQSLAKYKNSDLAIAFRFNPPVGGAQQYHLWQILDFEVNGEGYLAEDGIKNRNIFSGQSIPKGFHAFSESPDGASWRIAQNKFRQTFMLAASGTDTKALLLTPKYYIEEGMQEASLSISQTFNKAAFDESAFSKMQILVSKDYIGGDVQTANWEVLDYKESLPDSADENFSERFTKEGFAKVLVDKVSLQEYVGEEVVFAFQYESEALDKHIWQLNGYTLNGFGGQISRLDYKLGCFRKDPFEKDIFDSFNLDKSDSEDGDTVDREITERPAIWKITEQDTGSCNPKTFFQISAHTRRGSRFGKTRKILPAIDLSDKGNVSVRILHSLRFWSKLDTTQIQISTEGSDVWETLSFPEGTFKDKSENILSSWLKLPEAYLGKKVLIGFLYNAYVENGRELKPNWSIKKFEFKEDSQ